MKLRARPYLHYAPVPGGVYVGSARGQLVLRGSDLLFRVADVVIPLLETGATEDDLVAAVGTEKSRPVVRHLVTELGEHDMLLNPAERTTDEPPPDVRERYEGSIAYLESIAADPYAAFATLRTTTVAVSGPPEAVRPAARGLTRAGVGQVVQDDRAVGVDAVIRCVGRDDVLRFDGSLVIPVLLDDDVLIAGPVVRDEADAALWTALRARALDWAAADAVEPAARPVADALIGALAAQLLFQVVTGLAADGAAHVVHGADLTAEQISVGLPGGSVPTWRYLDDAEAVPMPEVQEAVDAVVALTARWTGLFTHGVTELDLPQLPLSQRELVYRTGSTGSVFAWGPDLQTAYVGAALAALRRTGGAAGLTEDSWLLDGALRRLAGQAQPISAASEQDMERETYRIWQSFVAQYPGAHTISLLAVPDLDWRLARVEAADGAVLGAAWAPDTDRAVRGAVGTALATVQIRRAGPRIDPVLNTDALLFAPGAILDTLRKQTAAHAAAAGETYRGRAHRSDAVLGTLPFWYGPVQTVPFTQEQTDAH